jgi:hypothetical protein
MRRLLSVTVAGFILAAALAAAADDKTAKDKADDKKFSYIDLQPKGNQKLNESLSPNRPNNDLAELKAGEHDLEGVKFKVGEKLIQLGSLQLPDGPEKVEGIKVDKKFDKLHILHSTAWNTENDTIIGEYTITWDDDTTITIPITYGKDVLDWWYRDDSPEPTEGKVVWKGENEASKALNSKIRLYRTTWDNPKPDLKVKSIDYSATKKTNAAPFCVAMTVEETKK